MSNDPAVEIRGLVKRYGTKTAVDGLDLTVRRGSVTAVLGPNGAGKTTTVETCEATTAPTTASSASSASTRSPRPRPCARGSG